MSISTANSSIKIKDLRLKVNEVIGAVNDSGTVALGNTNSYIATKASSANPTTSGLLAHTGRATISTNLSVSGNTTLSKLILSNVLSPTYGGTGLSSVTPNGILFGANSSILGYLTGTSGQILQINSNGVPTFDKLDGGDY